MRNETQNTALKLALTELSELPQRVEHCSFGFICGLNTGIFTTVARMGGGSPDFWYVDECYTSLHSELDKAKGA